MQLDGIEATLDNKVLTDLFNKLKRLYLCEHIDQERKNYIEEKVLKYGYLPYSHQKALEELNDSEVILGIEKKLEFASTYKNNEINYTALSPLERKGIKNSKWLQKEQHNIKLINLAALGDGNKTQNPGKFIDWLRQLLILPVGKPADEVMSTTIYLTPFHPREFGCAYLPSDTGVSKNIECEKIKSELGITAKDQVKLFLSLSQLCSHPIIYDILPQTARFSKLVLKSPFIARWFDIPQLISKIEEELDKICEDSIVKNIIKNELNGKYKTTPEEKKEIKEIIEKKLLKIKKQLSEKMLRKDYQEILQQRAKEIIQDKAGYPFDKQLEEKDIQNQGEIIGELISNGLWPSPGGAWCSAGIPIFDKMSKDAQYPTFKHYDFEGKDVTELANLDCQTPYYFTFLEDGTINQPVVDFFIDLLKQMQNEYNFDGFRVDHIDHIVNQFSEDKYQKPISYRAPRKVLAKLNSEMKKNKPYFASLAEYMLWDNFYKEYHQDMGFDVLWGQDIVCQHDKTVKQIFEDNKYLSKYNSKLENKLSILKTYNNQDGEFEAINRYPGQLGERGALFKWLKQKTIIGGKDSKRPCLYVDGDESFTKTGIERVIGEEVSMKRNNNQEFFEKFDAINRFALESKILRTGKARLIDNENNFTSWIIENDTNEAIFIVANEAPPTQKTTKDGKTITEKGKIIEDKKATIPKNYKVTTKYEFNGIEMEQKSFNTKCLNYKTLKPSEFHMYKLVKE